MQFYRNLPNKRPLWAHITVYGVQDIPYIVHIHVTALNVALVREKRCSFLCLTKLPIFTDNHYVYFESTDSRFGEEAFMFKSEVPFKSDCFCLVFDFHMFGAGIGNLTVSQANFETTGEFGNVVHLLHIQGRTCTLYTCTLTVLARVSRPGWLSWHVFKSGRRWLARGGGLALLHTKFGQSTWGWLKRKGRLTRANTVPG